MSRSRAAKRLKRIAARLAGDQYWKTRYKKDQPCEPQKRIELVDITEPWGSERFLRVDMGY